MTQDLSGSSDSPFVRSTHPITARALEPARSPGVHKARPSEPPPSDVPELQHTVLDEAGLRSLFADLTDRSLLEATVRASPSARPRRVTRLGRLLTRLVERRVFGAQFRYEHGGAIWLDTLIATTGGVRLVRLDATP